MADKRHIICIIFSMVYMSCFIRLFLLFLNWHETLSNNQQFFEIKSIPVTSPFMRESQKCYMLAGNVQSRLYFLEAISVIAHVWGSVRRTKEVCPALIVPFMCLCVIFLHEFRVPKKQKSDFSKQSSCKEKMEKLLYSENFRLSTFPQKLLINNFIFEQN